MSNIQPNDNIATQLLQMDGEIRVDSRLLAKGTDIQHESMMKTIYTYQPELEEFGKVRFEIGSSGKTNQPQKYALLNRNQSGIVISLSRNTPKVVRFKVDLFKAIDKLERELALTKQELAELKEALLEAENAIDRLFQLQESSGTLYDLSWPLSRHHDACDQIEEAARKATRHPSQMNIDRLTYTMKSYLPEARGLKKAFNENIENLKEMRKVMQLYRKIGLKIHPELTS